MKSDVHRSDIEGEKMEVDWSNVRHLVQEIVLESLPMHDHRLYDPSTKIINHKQRDWFPTLSISD